LKIISLNYSDKSKLFIFHFSYKHFIFIRTITSMDKYKTIKILGDGAFGTVYKAMNTKTN